MLVHDAFKSIVSKTRNFIDVIIIKKPLDVKGNVNSITPMLASDLPISCAPVSESEDKSVDQQPAASPRQFSLRGMTEEETRTDITILPFTALSFAPSIREYNLQIAEEPRNDEASVDTKTNNVVINQGALSPKKNEDNDARDPYGFPVPSDRYDHLIKYLAGYSSVRAQRKSLWLDGTMLNSDFTCKWVKNNRDSRSLKLRDLSLKGKFLGSDTTKPDVTHLIRLGIPNELRAKIWLLTSGALHKRNQHTKMYFESLVQSASDMSIKNSDREQIMKDINRTFPRNHLFSAERKESLRRVLLAYSERNKRIGYCQSMNFICAMLLMILREEQAFWVLSAIMEDILPPQYHSIGMLDMHLDQRVLWELIGHKLPRLRRYLEEHSIPLTLICSGWFLPLFVTVLPTETLLRLWDVFFHEGLKVLFRVALSIFKLNEEEILKQTDPSMLYKCVKECPTSAINCEEIMKEAFEGIGAFSDKRIDKLRKWCLPLVLKELEEFRQPEKKKLV
eukprot:TRINITY_DN4012_c0_g1_i1.p1 TRINITY_DN4012_c0_g1~~TRINITY_DN4012_c0_g1_i1.p1  ORF type:complete len:506 (+),score=63.25 TRINITY_DN4012_c0_g1_i1:314-1831(+)